MGELDGVGDLLAITPDFTLNFPLSKRSVQQSEPTHSTRALRRVSVVCSIICLVETHIILNNGDDIVLVGAHSSRGEGEPVVCLLDNIAVVGRVSE
jgi:hypothetical protein